MTEPKFGNCKAEATLRQEGERCGDGGDRYGWRLNLVGKSLRENRTQWLIGKMQGLEV